jgi:hypothetical protein
MAKNLPGTAQRLRETSPRPKGRQRHDTLSDSRISSENHPANGNDGATQANPNYAKVAGQHGRVTGPGSETP